MHILNVAQEWIDSGQSIIPVTYHSKRPAFDALRATGNVVDGEITWSPFKEKLATLEELKVWFSGPKRNLAIVTGYNGLVVMDFDSVEVYDAWCGWADSVGGIAAECRAKTLKVYSARGVHLYVICAEIVTPFKVANIDIKAQWGYVLAPPSTHPSGSEYRGVGKEILRCDKLEQVFPLTRPEVVAEMTGAAIANDPWEVAAQAVECSGMGSVEKIKSHMRIEDLLGVTCKSKRFMMLCPIHKDSNPSMQVDLNRQTVYCYGCGFHGDVIALYGALHHLGNREAIAVLAQS